MPNLWLSINIVVDIFYAGLYLMIILCVYQSVLSVILTLIATLGLLGIKRKID